MEAAAAPELGEEGLLRVLDLRQLARHPDERRPRLAARQPHLFLGIGGLGLPVDLPASVAVEQVIALPASGRW